MPPSPATSGAGVGTALEIMPLSRRRSGLPIDETMQSEDEQNYTRTDVVVAIILATIVVVWILAYIVFFVKSGAA